MSFVSHSLAIRRSLAALLVLAPAGTTLHAQTAIPAGFRAEFLNSFGESAAKLESLAEAMPADKYAWSPGPGVMPVAQVYGHIARYNYGYPATAMTVPPPPGIGLDTLERMTSKAQLVALLKASNAHVRRLAETMPDRQLAAPTRLYGRDVQQWAVLFQLLTHMNEHLGQSIAYARMNGVVPPWSR